MGAGTLILIFTAGSHNFVDATFGWRGGEVVTFGPQIL